MLDASLVEDVELVLVDDRIALV
uniref:Uncharacterized protein n=1 Tax=Ralstonia solanacearum TaxID=305 RepID=A0A0S4U101_RALSL|nr:conserved protein of unknown function [Ralstonia solanacearum]CUV19984.1 conserved protein of unknown function [Ralstonia solanacearum]CUV21551.1 conserved protein of unknown function [Ralstonia solanacearum]CUV28275.1 conserved protein of unknown function [Ralstonia solanacearum]CUV37381.1 conserved protein of unknown function [Ralstonia solanacearum]